ncbi:uncharacterized protein [Globicephala melas]|uniref:uncharacterized protein n=1 Tax=Globicephala melas TaxID=9731 RepID=UPI00293D3D2F|nr:SH3 and multiple ankyrin repeat domains protein 1-like [Globicephala melas]
MEVVPMMNVRVVMEGVGMSIPIDYNILLWKIIVAFGVLCDAVVRADASGDLSRGHARYLEATFLFHLSSAWRKRLCLQLSLRKEVQALWRRRLWSRQRRCCRRWRLEQRRRRKILGRWGTTTNAGTCCTESRGAATTTAPSRQHCRVRHLPSTNVCSGRGRGRGGGGLGRLVHCAGYRGAEEASAISFGTVIFVCKTPRRKTGPDAPPGAIPPPPPSQPKALAASAFEGELREGRMNEGEQNSRGPEGGTPSVLRHSLSPLASHPPLYSASRGVRGRREGKTRGGGRLGEGVGKPRNAHLLRTTPKPPPPLLPPRRRRPLQNPPGRSARRRRRRASVAFPSPPPAPPPPANPELTVAQTSPPGPAGPARPSPHALRTLSNPLGSRRLLREETLAAAEAGAARLEAGRRRGAGYGEPSNGARAGAQRRRVLAEHGRGAAAAVAAGAQGPLHHWQPWSPSIFLPLGRRLGSAHVLGEEGAGARASPEGGGTCASADDASRSSPLPLQPVRPHPAAPAVRAGGGRRRRRRLLSRRRWWPEGLLQRLQPTPFKGTRASRVSVPRSPPPPRHESGFLPRRVEEPSSSSPHLGSTPARAALAPSEDAPALGAAGSAKGRWLLGIDAPFCAAQLQLPCGRLAFRRPRASQPGRYCSCLQLTA